jgi:hypothetical protein
MRNMIILLALTFVVTMTAIVGARMSAQTMAVVVGVVCGASAGIPVSLLILAATQRRKGYGDQGDWRRERRTGTYPPVVVIQGGSQGPSWPSTYSPGQLQPPFYGTAVDASPRSFRVVGEEDWEAS